jgi:hypothetical protein
MEEAEKDNYSWFVSYVDVLLFYEKKLELVRFAEKSWLKLLFANLLWEKNTISTKTTSTMPVLTLRLYLRGAYENNEFFDTV